VGSPFAGRAALIAGASQGGTGTGTAVRLASQGARVAICARDAGKLEETLRRVQAVGGQGVMFQCDLSDPAGGRETLVARTEDALGPIAYLVYVAAYGGFAKFDTVSPDELQKALEANVKAPWLLTQQTVTSLRRRRASGAIVTIGTNAARPINGPPFPESPQARAGSLCGATKAALHRLTQSVASETYGEGISVNVLAPQRAIGTPRSRAAGWIPEEMFEPVETMVEAVLALLSGDPMTLTGQDVLSCVLLHALRRPVYDLTGMSLIDGWQPDDLAAYIEARRKPFSLEPPLTPP
jgi:NAD(P)-dependent dehydrogenase (short-subunit alcohol dehydrogenase family)